MQPVFNNVLILSASAGAGHVRAAQATLQAFQELGAAREVTHVDTLEYTNKLFRNLYSKAYLDMVNRAPDVLGWLYDQWDRPWQNERQRLAFDKLNTGPLIKLLKRTQAEFVVCTHFLPAELISWLKAKQRISYRQAIVVTDYDVHAMWLARHHEHYFVALDETKEHLARLGIPRDNLTVSGIPIDPVFSQKKDKREMRAKLGLEADRATILVSAGGFGVGPIDHMMEALLEMRHAAQVLVMCGRNEKMQERIEAVARRAGDSANVRIRAVGYTTAMDEYMAASDIVLGKPGGLTMSEALARGLVFVIVNPIPGQEERNADHLLEDGAAIRCNNLPVLGYKIDALLDRPARMEAMRESALRIARPNAARTIVERLVQLQREHLETQVML
ncbi:MAG: glycosyltransferase [Bacteroidetes bacterium]|nr:glycosyltransferase [Bacteroidota bacterium]